MNSSINKGEAVSLRRMKCRPIITNEMTLLLKFIEGGNLFLTPLKFPLYIAKASDKGNSSIDVIPPFHFSAPLEECVGTSC